MISPIGLKTMVRNWDYRDRHMDFSSMYQGNDHPSDIDMFYIGKGKFLIIGEIKNERYTLDRWQKSGQRKLLQSLIDCWRFDGLAIYVTHDKYVQNGDKEVDISECFVQEIYEKRLGYWRMPKRKVKVKEIINYYRGGNT